MVESFSFSYVWREVTLCHGSSQICLAVKSGSVSIYLIPKSHHVKSNYSDFIDFPVLWALDALLRSFVFRFIKAKFFFN